jgi:dTDP-glucose 4,6-dehydratase
MKFLVTGGAGFIGSALVRWLIDNSHSVINLDKLTYAGHLESLETVENHKNYHFEKGDICDGELVGNLFKHYKPDGVIHLAAESHVDRSIYGSAEFIRTNIIGTHNLLE